MTIVPTLVSCLSTKLFIRLGESSIDVHNFAEESFKVKYGYYSVQTANVVLSTYVYMSVFCRSRFAAPCILDLDHHQQDSNPCHTHNWTVIKYREGESNP